jgi:hypothetical protein
VVVRLAFTVAYLIVAVFAWWNLFDRWQRDKHGGDSKDRTDKRRARPRAALTPARGWCYTFRSREPFAQAICTPTNVWKGCRRMPNAEIAAQIRTIVQQVETVIVGKRDTVERAVVALLCNGHLLIEDIPGVGKTTLAKSLALSLGCVFKRIQFTPDLLPSDITGTSIYNQKTGEFEFRAGPVFANIVLADEINRATPKTQAALLECMDELQVTEGGVTHPLLRPFFVIATQNNIEHAGTYPCPKRSWTAF